MLFKSILLSILKYLILYKLLDYFYFGFLIKNSYVNDTNKNFIINRLKVFPLIIIFKKVEAK